jgi:serine/threonine protein kinase
MRFPHLARHLTESKLHALDQFTEQFDALSTLKLRLHARDLLPERDSPLYLPSLAVSVLLAMERDLKHGRDARVGDYLDRFPELHAADDERVKDILEAMFRLRERHGLAPQTLDLRRWFPALERSVRRRLGIALPALSGQQLSRSKSGLWLPAPSSVLPVPVAKAAPQAERTTYVPAVRREAQAPAAGRGRAPRKRRRGRARLRWSDFEQFQLLDQGYFGAVYEARHKRTGHLHALKLLRDDLRPDAEMLARFQREIRLAMRLKHPNVVKVHGAGKKRRSPFLALELIDGPSLDKLVREQGVLPVARAADYLRQAALGLQHIHERGLVHRDIKPANLMLTRAGVVKIVDLGLARLYRPERPEEATAMLTARGTVSGTPAYMAPEQWIDFHGADIRADIYSLGCTFYHLLTGRAPLLTGPGYERPEPLEELRPDVPAGLAVVVRRMMARQPADRFQTPAEVAEAVACFCAAPASVPPLFTAAPQLEMPTRRDSRGIAGYRNGPPQSAARTLLPARGSAAGPVPNVSQAITPSMRVKGAKAMQRTWNPTLDPPPRRPEPQRSPVRLRHTVPVFMAATLFLLIVAALLVLALHTRVAESSPQAGADPPQDRKPSENDQPPTDPPPAGPNRDRHEVARGRHFPAILGGADPPDLEMTGDEGDVLLGGPPELRRALARTVIHAERQRLAVVPGEGQPGLRLRNRKHSRVAKGKI